MLQFLFTYIGLFRYIKKHNFTIEGNSSSVFDHHDDGFLLVVPHDTLKQEEKCQVSVDVIFCGTFILPEGATLVSAIYDVTIDCEKKVKLQQEIEIRVQHCVDVSDANISKNMYFAFAESDLRSKTFRFTKVDHGIFGPENATMLLKQSSLCVVYFNE